MPIKYFFSEPTSATESKVRVRKSGLVLMIATALGPMFCSTILMRCLSAACCQGTGLKSLLVVVKSMTAGMAMRLRAGSGKVRSRLLSGLTFGMSFLREGLRAWFFLVIFQGGAGMPGDKRSMDRPGEEGL